MHLKLWRMTFFIGVEFNEHFYSVSSLVEKAFHMEKRIFTYVSGTLN